MAKLERYVDSIPAVVPNPETVNPGPVPSPEAVPIPNSVPNSSLPASGASQDIKTALDKNLPKQKIEISKTGAVGEISVSQALDDKLSMIQEFIKLELDKALTLYAERNVNVTRIPKFEMVRRKEGAEITVRSDDPVVLLEQYQWLAEQTKNYPGYAERQYRAPDADSVSEAEATKLELAEKRRRFYAIRKALMKRQGIVK